MGLDPIIEDFRYEIKENMGRRGIALFIDQIVMAIPIFFFTAIFLFIIFQSNPFSVVIGQIAPLLYNYEIYGVTATPTFAALIPSFFITLGVMITYFTIFESNGRRTLGKRSLHLEVLRMDGKFLTPMQAFRRNILKFIAGAIGFYLLGLIGWGFFTAIFCLLDLKLSPGKKRDVRQRLTEASMATMVYLEHDELPIGEISIPGEKIHETKEKKKKPKPERKMGSSPKKGAPSLLGASPKKDILLPKEKKRPLLEAPDEKEPEVGKEPISLLDRLDEDEEETDEEAEEKPKKASFFSKLFGGSKKEKVEEQPGDEESVDGSDSKKEIGLPPRKEIARDEIVLQFMFDFDIDENRANGLYDMGYRNKPEFKDAIPQDLMMIDGINPTIAKRIIARAGE